MIDPSFWDDEYIGHLTDSERIFIIGCVGNADDEGRLKGSVAYLKAAVWMYDKEKDDDYCTDLKQKLLKTMEAWPSNHTYRIIQYKNGNAEYLFFPMWDETNRPSHPTKSKLPAPSPELFANISRTTPEDFVKSSGAPPSQSSIGQSSQGQSSLGKVSIGQGDFAKILNSEKDLTDYLTDLLTKKLGEPGGGGTVLVAEEIKNLWRAKVGSTISGDTYGRIYDSLKKYKPKVLAISLVKTMEYAPGKRDIGRYYQSVLEEKSKSP
jgi:hypothetical protein